ncbi:MAG: hypothetical protein P1U58_05920 [Verrucomicrobiales bacterium]|nr:hypothetical protein [Verrucomicrobiales bacterium]
MSDTPPPLQPESPQYTSPAPSGGSSSGSGKKWGIGCGIGCLVVLVIGAILGIVGFNYAKKAVVTFVENSTSEMPVELEAPLIAPETIESAVKRFDEFSVAMENGDVTGPIELTDEDINALIANHPKFSAVSDSMVVSIEGDQLTSEVSVSLNDLDIPESFISDAIAGKFFNGEVTLRAQMQGGQPALFIDGLSIGGKPIPAQFMSELSKENILKEASSDPELKPYLDKIGDLRVESGKLIIAPAGNAN